MSRFGKASVAAVRIMRETDTDPNDDLVSAYGNEPREFAIDREARGDMRHGEYRYYYGPVENYKGSGDDELREYIEQDYARAEAYNRGEWHFLCIYAEAVIHIPTQDGHVISTIRTPGLWGIESDSEESYLQETGEDEAAELRDLLEAFSQGLDLSKFDELVKNAEVRQE